MNATLFADTTVNIQTTPMTQDALLVEIWNDERESMVACLDPEGVNELIEVLKSSLIKMQLEDY